MSRPISLSSANDLIEVGDTSYVCLAVASAKITHQIKKKEATSRGVVLESRPKDVNLSKG